MSGIATATLLPDLPRRRLRLTRPVMAEGDFHELVAIMLARLVMPPAEWTTFPAGNVPLPPEFAAKLARLGLKRGWPDILVLHERIHGIELKREGGGLSKTRLVRTRRGALRQLDGQEDVFPRLELAGMPICVCRTVNEVIDALRVWGVPLRGSVAA